MSTLQNLLRSLLRAVRSANRERPRSGGSSPRRSRPNATDSNAPRGATEPGQSEYAGDFRGAPTISYEPVADDLPDPGEVVWAWVPFEEDHSQGKDRPVLVIGRDDGLLLALQMSSQDHDKDAEDEARWGRYWVDVGAGAWDREGRPSEARVDRILRVDPTSVRRIGAVLARERFDEVAAGVREHA